MSALTLLQQQAKRDEEEILFPRFTADTAWDLGCFMVQKAREKGAALVISITANDQTLFCCALEGTHLNHSSAVVRKSAVSHVFRCSSLSVFCELQLSGTSIADRGRDPKNYLALGGAIPIRVAGAGMIGTVCVSGLSHTDDHNFVAACVKEFLQGLQ